MARPRRTSQLFDGDLASTTDYRNLLAEVLEKRCGASAANINDIFPGITSARPNVVNQLP